MDYKEAIELLQNIKDDTESQTLSDALDIALECIKFNVMVENWIDGEEMDIIAEYVLHYGIEYVKQAVKEKGAKKNDH